MAGRFFQTAMDSKPLVSLPARGRDRFRRGGSAHGDRLSTDDLGGSPARRSAAGDLRRALGPAASLLPGPGVGVHLRLPGLGAGDLDYPEARPSKALTRRWSVSAAAASFSSSNCADSASLRW